MDELTPDGLQKTCGVLGCEVGMPAPWTPAYENGKVGDFWYCPRHRDPVPGSCDEFVEIVGFADGHSWREFSFVGHNRSIPLYCWRCGENGWRILDAG